MAFYFDKIALNWVRRVGEGKVIPGGKKGTKKNQSDYLPLQIVSRVGLEKQHFKSDKPYGNLKGWLLWASQYSAK